MGHISSLYISIPSISTIIMGGIIVFLGDNTTVAYGLWGVAIIWIISMVIYRMQRVEISILEYELQSESPTGFSIVFEGVIQSRHPDVLKDLRLWLHPDAPINAKGASSKIPHSISNKPQLFTGNFSVAYSFLEQAIEEQATDGVNIACLLSVNMLRADWVIPGPILQVGLIKNGQVGRFTAKGRTKKTATKRKGGLGIHKKQFHALLDRVAQPIKKSEKGKS